MGGGLTPEACRCFWLHVVRLRFEITSLDEWKGTYMYGTSMFTKDIDGRFLASLRIKTIESYTTK